MSVRMGYKAVTLHRTLRTERSVTRIRLLAGLWRCVVARIHGAHGVRTMMCCWRASDVLS